jgi:hypothetical protein
MFDTYLDMALTRHFSFIVSRLVQPSKRKVEKDERGRYSIYITQNATGGTKRIGSKEDPKAKNWLFPLFGSRRHCQEWKD